MDAAETGYKVNDRRGANKVTEPCRVCGAPGSPEPHSREYGKPTMECIAYLRNSKLSVEDIAKVAHEVNRAYCQSLGDTSQMQWHDAPDWQRESCVNGVKHHIEHPNETPQGSHEVWLAEKKATGWKYGPVKDAEKKEHPCFLPYEQLKETDKAKDFIFRAVVRQLKEF